jgi:integrase/recombinase XerD
MNEHNRTLLKGFLEESRILGAREQNLKGLRNRVPKLLHYLEQQEIDVERLRVKDATAYQGWLIETGKRQGGKYRKNTIVSYVKAAAGFFEYIKRSGRIAANPFKEMRRVSAERKLPRNLLKEKEMDAFLDGFTKWNDEPGHRNRKRMYLTHVVAELLYSTGMRISEAAGLSVADIDFGRNLVIVREGKGGTSRVCFLSEYAREVLRLYVDEMRDIVSSEWNERNAELLFGVKWMPFGRIMNKKLAEIAGKLELPRVTNHVFRHAVGYHLLRAGCPIRHIQTILGHKSIKNTEVYTKVDKEALKDVLDRFHPRTFKGSAR